MGGEKLDKIIDAARMYYQLDYSQQDIAKHLGVSRPTVSRFLQQAKADGIVQIKIMDPTENNENLASQLEEQFKLQKVIVVSVPQYEESIVKKYLGEAAAEFLYEVVKDGDTIATSWGTTLYEVAVRLQNKHVKDVAVVQLNGGVSYSEYNTYASEIIHLFGGAYNTNPHLLPLPAIVDHTVVKQAIEADRHIRKILDMGKRANIAVFTVGVPTEDSVLMKANYFSTSDLEVIHEKGVGDICSRFIDLEGGICSEELDRRTIGIDLVELRKKERSVLVAGGVKKVDAIYGAIRGKYTNTLITDQFTAKYLLEYKA
ncbi:sugar-binding transcriptional regulator [Paenibacillus planticolens]|uniref:Helix-turn-helix domain-containing protein n=1 Tax=Paenibacillus planticolens TaxID=2654976 RepID=A0ABX1ZID1_9BACL|nr:sugar-binding transcriptional regulator [Paenibacillus planticolens]NOU99831.1 helix-turn-helix domain-containing protein [Paenibacillus planticolens]